MEPGPASLPIDRIVVPDGRRALRGVPELAASIAEVGLIHPITVTPDARLVAGYHRLEACRGLGWAEIAATVVAADALTAKLIELDENLRRNEGTYLERGEWLAERKGIYEALHPETRRGGDRRSEGARSNGDRRRLIAVDSTGGASAAIAPAPKVEPEVGLGESGRHAVPPLSARPFVRDTAAKTGRSERSVREDIQIAENVAPQVKERIRETPIADNKTDLRALAQSPPEEQAQLAEAVLSGDAKDVKEAKRRKDKEQAEAEQAVSDAIFRVVGDPEGRVARARMRAAFSEARAVVSNKLLVLNTESAAAALEPEDTEHVRSFVRRCRGWLDGLETEMGRGLRVVARRDA